ncbi:hypothetical protein ACWEQL_00570 [Kitasatospora sp. NPDC004240]
MSSTYSVTPIIRNTLVCASQSEAGLLPTEGLSNKMRSRILEAGWAEQPAGTTQLVITLAGRRAILSHPQLSALITAQADDRLAPSAM